MQLGTWQRICLVDTNIDNHQPARPVLLPRRLTGRSPPQLPGPVGRDTAGCRP